MEFLYFFIAILLVLAGTGMLYFSWSGKFQGRNWPVTAGWSACLLSVYFWYRFDGPEFGLVYFMLALPLTAWLFVMLNPQQLRQRNGKLQHPRNGFHGIYIPRHRLAFHLQRFLLVMPLAGLSATYSSIVFSSLMPWSELDRWVFAMFAMPVVWGLIAWWLCTDSIRKRPVIANTVVGAVCATLVHLEVLV